MITDNRHIIPPWHIFAFIKKPTQHNNAFLSEVKDGVEKGEWKNDIRTEC
jgi:hypothetical protein